MKAERLQLHPCRKGARAGSTRAAEMLWKQTHDDMLWACPASHESQPYQHQSGLQREEDVGCTGYLGCMKYPRCLGLAGCMGCKQH